MIRQRVLHSQVIGTDETGVKINQLCTARLERETKYLEERYKVAWPIRFQAMLREAHKLKK